jgi:hypothetical protein
VRDAATAATGTLSSKTTRPIDATRVWEAAETLEAILGPGVDLVHTKRTALQATRPNFVTQADCYVIVTCTSRPTSDQFDGNCISTRCRRYWPGADGVTTDSSIVKAEPGATDLGIAT